MEHHHRTVNPALSSSSHSISTTGNNERSLFRSRLLPAFSYSARPSSFEQDNVLEVIDTFAPRLQSQSDLSPTSAASSSSRSSGASDFSFAHTASFSTSSASSAADLAASRVIRVSQFWTNVLDLLTDITRSSLVFRTMLLSLSKF